MDHYLNEAEVASAMQSLAATFPDDCALITLPHTTFENRTVQALRIGAKTSSLVAIGQRRFGVLFTGSAHAREWGGADILIYLASDLLAAYAANKGLTYAVTNKGPGITFTARQLQRLRESADIFLVPCVNPDGRAYSMTADPMWRKNRNPASSGGQAHQIGVDVNRNFDFLWDFRKAFAAQAQNAGSMASDNPAYETFRGAAPNSEPETRNVIHTFASNPQIGYFVDVHSYTGDVLYSWGDAPNQTVDPPENFLNGAFDGKRGIDDLAIYGEHIPEKEEAAVIGLAEALRDAANAVASAGYAVTQGFYLAAGSAGGSAGRTYPTGGTADDYATARARSVPGATAVKGFTLEFHRDSGLDSNFAFHPPFPKMAEVIAEADAGLIAFCLAAMRENEVPLHVPDIVAEVLFGVTNDGGGIVLINGKPKRIPPSDPLIPALARALGVYTEGQALPGKQRREAQQAALDAMNVAVKVASKQQG